MTRGTTDRTARRIGLALVAVTLLGVGVACGEPDPPPPPVDRVSIATTPGMFPAFDAEIIDYVVRCDGNPVHLVVDGPADHELSINGGPFQAGHQETDVALTPGAAVTVVDLALLRDYVIRCLPYDYPQFSVSGHGQQAEYYLTLPFGISGLSLTPQYATIFDRNGVPVWWSKDRLASNYATLFDNRDLAIVRNDGQPTEVASLLFGSPVNTITVDGMPGGATFDGHDVLRLANGNYVVVYNIVTTMDVSGAFPNHSGDPSLTSAGVLDHVLVEVEPDGTVVWSWKTSDHIAPSELAPQWEETLYTGLHPNGYDIYHWNSVERTPTGYMLSFRHNDAIYAITRDPGQPDDGDVEWKLGGTTRPESLDIVGDPVFTGGSGFGGQHDARRLPDGTITLHDNGTNLSRAPRGVRYDLDLDTPVGTGGTATLVEQVRDEPGVPSSFCCGSARRLPGGNWLFGFGSSNAFEEIAPTGDIARPDGDVVFRVAFSGGPLEYRTEPIAPGFLNFWYLRIAMALQYG